MTVKVGDFQGWTQASSNFAKVLGIQVYRAPGLERMNVCFWGP